MNPSIFKAYDIRGIYPEDLDEATAYAVGRAVVEHFSLKVVAVGRDIRTSSPSLFAQFTRGVLDAGADVVDLGIITTPMVYFAAGRLDVDAAISITASHNPPQYNGMKISLRGAIPVGLENGLADIRDRALSGEFQLMGPKGTLSETDIKPAYYGYFSSFADFKDRHFTAVIDTANAMGILELPIYDQFPESISVVNLYNDLTRPFECHEANPLKLETLTELQAKVIETEADFGIAYDGDADRVGFVDETGTIVPMDLMTALLAETILTKKPGATILYDLRSSRAVKEIIEESGGKALECKVGHANIKRQMRETGAVFAGELSGHYYFEENSFAEDATLPAILIMNLMAETGKTLSVLVQNAKRYFHSGEINSTVEDKDAVLDTLCTRYADGKQHELDGLKVDYDDWWFNVRSSNTEPLLRLNLEAKTKEMMETKKAELLAIIRGE
jgi:phosphomannomutase